MLAALMIVSASAFAQTIHPILRSRPSAPTSSRFRLLEEYMRELPLNQRVPRLESVAEWRRYAARDFAKGVVFTSAALQLSRHMDPAYLRGREYFIQEYLDYALLRDLVYNKIDVSKAAQQEEYEAHREDFVITPTVTLRYIRTRSAEKATSAAARLAAGEDFVAVERDASEVSPRYIGRVLGPFPSEKERMQIPPPQEVLDAALATPIGETTGPIKTGPFYFLSRTEATTTGGLATLGEVAEKVEERLRAKQGGDFVKQLIATLRQELAIKQDYELLLKKENVSPRDVIATVGATLVPRSEFDDLAGRVRGPARSVAEMFQNRLTQFITPLIIAEGARMRGYLDHEETRRAIYYYDVQHLSSWFLDRQALLEVKEPTERELRFRLEQNFNELKRESKTTPTLEKFRDSMREAMLLERRPVVENDIVDRELTKLGFAATPKPRCSRLTAFEALVNAAPKIPAGSQILEIGEAQAKEEYGSLWYTGVGRNASWRITYVTPDKQMKELITQEGGPLNDSTEAFTSNPLYLPYADLWQFDTDALIRHAVDYGMGDFAAKHNNRMRVGARVEFAYSAEKPTSVTDCLIVYTAVPEQENSQDGLILKYSGRSGEITKRRIGDPEGPCPVCPGPDLPSMAVRMAAAGGSDSKSTAPVSGSKH